MMNSAVVNSLVKVELRRYSFLKNVLHFKRKYHPRTSMYGFRVKNNEKVLEHTCSSEDLSDNAKLYPLVTAFREHGHKKANINPVSISPPTSDIPELDFRRYGLNLDETYSFQGLINNFKNEGTVREAVKWLESTYCGKISPEFVYIDDFYERKWFQSKYEEIVHKNDIDQESEKEILSVLLKSQAFEKFVALKFVTLKRYSGEGAESALAFFHELFNLVSKGGISDIVVAAHHRGRLSFLTGLLGMPPELLFRKVKGKSEFPPGCNAIGDVSSHLCPSANLMYNNREINVRMSNLPSHLEAVCPVSLGQTRALQQLKSEGDYGSEGRLGDNTLNVQVHGDAAVMGQGVSHESLIMSCLPNFEVGGTIHLIINNQVGFTTPSLRGRGTRYSSDLAKIVSAPVIHVNGDFPNEVIKATRIAVEYQRKFRKNVFIDLNCFRRWGHNELDDPTFTNPMLYKIISNKRSVPDSYASYLTDKKVVSEDDVKKIQDEYFSELNKSLEACESFDPKLYNQELWTQYSPAPNAITTWDTGVDISHLQFIGAKTVEAPENFTLHPNLIKNHINSRLSKIKNGNSLDWGTCEALALGSLLYDGYNVRLCGQDVGRATFSHRHAMFVNQDTDDVYVPLNNISSKQHGRLEIVNSFLSEEAVLGFEYGFSTISPNNLVIWEAQFGDFFNGAQIQFDTYVTSGEDKWMTKSGLVVLLPHGYDGAGPEHSSCRIERFLQLSNSSETSPDGEDVNVHIVNPTNGAQYFHLLRRQMIRNYRKPLIVIAPKLLIRAPQAVSSLSEMCPDTSFSPVIGESFSDSKKIRRIILVSGKHYYALKEYRDEKNIQDTAIIRIEELVPFPVQQIREQIEKFKNVKEFIWSQEEPRNMGAWTFMKSRFENLIGQKITYCGRPPCSAPAVGIGEIHKKEAQFVIEEPFKK